MPLKLTIDDDRWSKHLQTYAEATSGLVPVAKGNGYGFTLDQLARRTKWLGERVPYVDTLAVGTYSELWDVARRFPGSLYVLTPWRPYSPEVSPELADRVIHTVSRPEDLPLLLARQPNARVILELVTSMRRHGMTPDGLWQAAAHARQHARFEGVTMHFGLEGGSLAEVRAQMDAVVGAEASTVWVSHMSARELAQLQTSYSDMTFRPRVGTALWLGDRGALKVTATVEDVHPLERGYSYGYRGRTALRAGHLIVAAGGTAHGIGLEAPLGDTHLRSRVVTAARGGLDAMGAARSPYSLDGKTLWFAEPPHMQESMLMLPAGARVPEVGEELDLRVRYTTTSFDEIDDGS
ncbi:MAG: alanine racemase [Nocardioides sp.]|nr:alanine racemase [Nocardioides sp.]